MLAISQEEFVEFLESIKSGKPNLDLMLAICDDAIKFCADEDDRAVYIEKLLTPLVAKINLLGDDAWLKSILDAIDRGFGAPQFPIQEGLIYFKVVIVLKPLLISTKEQQQKEQQQKEQQQKEQQQKEQQQKEQQQKEQQQKEQQQKEQQQKEQQQIESSLQAQLKECEQYKRYLEDKFAADSEDQLKGQLQKKIAAIDEIIRAPSIQPTDKVLSPQEKLTQFSNAYMKNKATLEKNRDTKTYQFMQKIEAFLSRWSLTKPLAHFFKLKSEGAKLSEKLGFNTPDDVAEADGTANQLGIG